MGRVTVYSPPAYPLLSTHYHTKSIFLGGSIEMGKARDWQKEFIDKLDKVDGMYDYTVLNPRRSDWDSTWKQSIEDGNFYQQVDWELDYLEKANYKVFVFAKDTVSPISLLEFGRFSTKSPNSILLYVEEGYGRKGNIDVYCHKYEIKKFESIEDIVKYLKY